MAVINPYDHPNLYDSIKLAGKRSPGLWTFSAPPTRDEGWDKQTAQGSSGSTLVHNQTPAIEFDGELLLWHDEFRDCFAEWEVWKPVLLLSAPRPQIVVPSPASIGANPKVQSARANLLATQAEAQKFRPAAGVNTPQGQAEIRAMQQKLVDAQGIMNGAVKGASAVSAPKRVAIDIYHPQLAGLNPPVTSVVVKSWTDIMPRRGKGTGSGTVKIKFLEQRVAVAVGSGTTTGSKSSGGGGGNGSSSNVNDPNADLKARVAQLNAEFSRP